MHSTSTEYLNLERCRDWEAYHPGLAFKMARGTSIMARSSATARASTSSRGSLPTSSQQGHNYHKYPLLAMPGAFPSKQCPHQSEEDPSDKATYDSRLTWPGPGKASSKSWNNGGASQPTDVQSEPVWQNEDNSQSDWPREDEMMWPPWPDIFRPLPEYARHWDKGLQVAMAAGQCFYCQPKPRRSVALPKWLCEEIHPDKQEEPVSVPRLEAKLSASVDTKKQKPASRRTRSNKRYADHIRAGREATMN
ncbi:hypothetical protein OE88DRAFT_1643642 [Heliocybe sulcata]|uniref:Uncharacterized protein n=1 Tax=Heliocybe sulcata TaxID=5364 RepID=A0A5C3NH77_9AGAM|nr:hypothetical protein OE88DRAFT_1643642 [Heliocybe sulcata]